MTFFLACFFSCGVDRQTDAHVRIRMCTDIDVRNSSYEPFRRHAKPCSIIAKPSRRACMTRGLALHTSFASNVILCSVYRYITYLDTNITTYDIYIYIYIHTHV